MIHLPIALVAAVSRLFLKRLEIGVFIPNPVSPNRNAGRVGVISTMKSRGSTVIDVRSPVVRSQPFKNQSVLERAFLLAYFIFPDRTAALRIVTDALNKLKSTAGQQRKRAYWRDKFLRGRITRITRDDEDTLQWLIYVESSAHEKIQEARGQSSIEDMVVRYVKTLIQLSTWMSSFYVNVAIHRLLYSYTTAEVQAIYEFVSDNYREADEYRRAKRLLMQRLESRFGDEISIIKADHGETRFRPAANQWMWNEPVLNCLYMFTPWSTQAEGPFHRHRAVMPGPLYEILSSNCEQRNDQDKIEIKRCHALIDPDCAGYIEKQLGLEQHSSKLGIPLFHMNADRNPRPPSSRLPDNSLTSQEQQTIAEVISAEEARRRNAIPRELRFIADGVECAHLRLGDKRNLCFDAPFDAQLLEVWTQDTQGSLLLATHKLAGDMRFEETKFKLSLGNTEFLSVSVLRPASETSGWTISASARQGQRASVLSQIRIWLARVPALPGYAALVVVLGAVFFVWNGMRHQLNMERSNERELKAELARELSTGTAEAQKLGAMVYHLTPDDAITRGGSGTHQPIVVVTPQVPVVINLELPVPRVNAQYRAALTQLGGGTAILTEDGLSPAVRGNEMIVSFSVPSKLLNSNNYYQIQLRAPASLDVSTFTFHTTSNHP